MPRTCWKGWLGRIRFCRLGFWHWRHVSDAAHPRAWQRTHGAALQPTGCTIGTTPPTRGLLAPERHHPYFTKINLAILAATKSNHDVSILLRGPPADLPNDYDTFLQFMLGSVRSTAFYITAYTSKVQPQLTNLWLLLQSGQATLEAELRDLPDPLPSLQHASKVFNRMISACQKRVHKSMPEMVQFLLRQPEAYKSHTFVPLFLTDLLRQAAALLQPEDQAASSPSNVVLLPATAGPDPTHPGTSGPVRPVPLVPQSTDYLCRGPDLAAWPLYFYVAGVRRVRRRDVPDDAAVVPFDCQHPLASSCVQVVALHTPWAVPRFIGSSLPDPSADVDRFAQVMLLLLKPWRRPDLRDLLHPVARDTSLPASSWATALAEYELSLCLPAPSPEAPLPCRGQPFSPRYWTQRAAHILQNARNLAGAPVDTNAAALRVNPDAAAGCEDSIELPPIDPSRPANRAPFEQPSDTDDDPDLAPPDIVEDSAEAEQLPEFVPRAVPVLTWHDVSNMSRGALDSTRSIPDPYRDSFLATHAPASLFQAVLPRPAPEAAVPIRAPANALRRGELNWDAVVAAWESEQALTASDARQLPLRAADVFTTVTTWFAEGRCNKPDNTINHKQAAMLLLHALWVHDMLVHQAMRTIGPPPTQYTILLGGPGTGKTHTLRLMQELTQTFLPRATRTAAPTHSAARLVNGRTLHSCLAIPLEGLSARNKSLGQRKEQLLADWLYVWMLFLDECSMVPAETMGVAEYRARQVRDSPHVPWGGLSVHCSGDFLQLPPVLATSLADPVEPPGHYDSDTRQRWRSHRMPALRGRAVWTQFTKCICLDYSHRCRGDLADIIATLRTSPSGLSEQQWRLLQSRVLRKDDARLRHERFAAPTAVLGVLRHAVRAALTPARAHALAASAGRRLCILPASDIIRGDDGVLARDPSFAHRCLAVHSLSATKNLPGFLFLWLGCELLLEEKLCDDLGLVRGCRVTLVDIIPSEGQVLGSHDPSLSPFVLASCPAGLVVRVPGATWIKDPTLGPGAFFISPRTRSWRFGPGANETDFQPATVARTQLPFTNCVAFTAYGLQGATVPGLIADLAAPPKMPREEFWMALYVLLSRVTHLDHLLLFRLPSPAQCSGGPPASVQAEISRLHAIQEATLRGLAEDTRARGLHALYESVVQPLLPQRA